ncbi:AraC family transcriptional regulator [Neptuniibacter sp. QD48_11]|uniref:helix-turn-helix domain-containing protein n=1 Tax=unclassified Neptuniibacter TaxID=2630693 RepID=UPI0039F5535C
MQKIKHTFFENKRLAALGIEPISFSDLYQKLPTVPERLEFYMLILVTKGHGQHCIDFIDYDLRPGTLLFVRPGQVQEWQDYCDLQAEVVLIDPAALPNDERVKSKGVDLLALQDWQNCTLLTELLQEDILQSISRLKRDFEGFDGSELDISLLRNELLNLLLRLARWQKKVRVTDQVTSRSRKTYQLFIDLLEQEYRTEHSLRFYAEKLGYAQSTLSRACIQVEGYSAKVVIDRRVALEARRMLVHSSASVAEVGYWLGFSEATNFVKFFRRMVGVTPQLFRERRSELRR